MSDTIPKLGAYIGWVLLILPALVAHLAQEAYGRVTNRWSSSPEWVERARDNLWDAGVFQ